MSKHFKFLVLALMLVGLTSGSAFAGTAQVTHNAANTPFTAALEAMGAARNIALVGGIATAATAPGVATVGAAGTNGPLQYLLTQNITSGNLVTVTFAGAAFDGSVIDVCAVNAAAVWNAGSGWVKIATATPTAGSISANFQTAFTAANTAVAAGNYIFLTGSGGCNHLIGAAINLPVRLSATASATNPTASIAINTAGNVPVDSSSAGANVAIIAAEYTAAMNAASNHTVDYLGTPGTGVQLLFNGAAGSNLYAYSPIVAVTKANYNLNAVNSTAAVGAANAGLTAGLVITATDSGSWQGVSKVFLNSSGGAANMNCTDSAGAGNVVGTGTPSGTVTLTLPSSSATAVGGFNASGPMNYQLCVIANGTTVLNTRTISAGADINITGTGPNDPAAGSVGAMDTWGLNAFQAMLPWGINSTLAPTYCLISNASTTNTASVILDILSSETAVTLANQSLGTIAPKTSKLVTVTGDTISMAGGSNVNVTTLGSNTRHMDRFTVTVAPASVTMSCQQTDPVTGSKRPVITLH